MNGEDREITSVKVTHSDSWLATSPPREGRCITPWQRGGERGAQFANPFGLRLGRSAAVVAQIARRACWRDVCEAPRRFARLSRRGKREHEEKGKQNEGEEDREGHVWRTIWHYGNVGRDGGGGGGCLGEFGSGSRGWCVAI